MRSLFIASLGNPGLEHAHTLHSAGHTLLAAICAHLQAPRLSKSSAFGPRALASTDPASSTTFWQSPDYMNTSGKPLAAAWRSFKSSSMAEDSHLVILHDEIELKTGKFSIKTNAGASARGHNGLKSFLAMPGCRELVFTRVGIGIGPRPLSRDPQVVADFVLRKMTGRERTEIEGLAEGVWEKLDGSVRQ